MGIFLSETLFKTFSSKYVYFKIHGSYIAKYTGRENTSEKMRHQIFKFVWKPTYQHQVFGEKFPTAEF
jgi:hypothetical protein